MRVLVSGASGLVGAELCQFLALAGHEVVRLVRRAAREGEPEIHWDIARKIIDLDKLCGFDAAVHLSGENIASGIWTKKKQEEIRTSRVASTALLCGALAKLKAPPAVLIAASAIGFYGDTGGAIVDEAFQAGTGFFAEVAREWEGATETARSAGIRVVNLRIGLVLSAKGGALSKMMPAFRLGLGGRLGNGKQLMSWIAIDDLVQIIYHCIISKEISGPVNAVAPHVVTNSEFSAALGEVLHRPALIPIPAFALRLVLGRLADEALLSSTGVKPARLQVSNYKFIHDNLKDALRSII